MKMWVCDTVPEILPGCIGEPATTAEHKTLNSSKNRQAPPFERHVSDDVAGVRQVKVAPVP